MPFRTRKGPPFTVANRWFGRIPVVGSLAALAVDELISMPRLGPILDDIVAFGHEHSIEAVWCPLQGQTIIRLALPVAERLNVPLLTQVWDPPGWWLREHRLHPRSQRSVMRQFGATLRASHCCAATSEPMAQEYAVKYQAKTVAIVPYLPESCRVPPAKSKPDTDRFVIGVAGQLYAKTEWQALLAALDRASWKIGGRQAVVAYLGNYPIHHSHPNACIEQYGSLSQDECIRTLSRFDVLYCPYWFDPVFEVECRLSFPSKLVSYLAASRPVFFHGPRYASAVPLINRRDVGRCCHSLAPEVILDDLQAVLGDPGLWTRLAKNAGDTFSECLSLEAQKPALARFFEIPDARLRNVA
jgi:hypothetical protein